MASGTRQLGLNLWSEDYDDDDGGESYLKHECLYYSTND